MTAFFSKWNDLCRAVAAMVLVLCVPAFAGPGAHGPGGEHLDAAANTGTGTTQPRVETKSESFELVGYLGAGELSVMINRFETNEPLLDARVEVSKGSSKAMAKFHSDHGDYSIDDPAFLKTLSAPGEHALIFTVVANNESDLLEGTLKVTPAQGSSHGHSHAVQYALIAAGALALLAIVAVLWQRGRRNRVRYAMTGGLS